MNFIPTLATAIALTASAAAEQPALWIYKSTNLQVDKNVDDLAALMQRAQRAGYTKILLADSKFSRLGTVPDRYFKNAARVQELAKQHGIEIVPTLFSIGYSSDLLSNDPNLAEALPVKNLPLIVKDNTAVVDDPKPPELPGGSFSDAKGWSWKDDNVVITDGIARVSDPKGNARFNRKITVEPWRQYHVRVRVRTVDFRGQPEIKALGEKGGLTFSELGVKPTQDWQTHHAVFNSQENRTVNLYFGVWGAAKGTLEWDDARIETVAFQNMPRRDGCPLAITTTDGRPLEEGRDFLKLTDTEMGMNPWPGEFRVWHEPPRLRAKLPNGTKLLASYYHTLTVHDGQAMICPSEPKTTQLLRDQANRMHQLWKARGYMMSHDEIRLLNHCAACRSRNLTPGQIIADNVKTCIGLLREVNPGGDIYVWSDMFDPNHNATPGPYYLVNGPLTRSWDGLDKDVIIVPWYFEKRDASLAFFADRGHRQVIAGYYDSNVDNVKDWLSAAAKVKGVQGIIYTTWHNRFDDLEAFANAAR